MEQTLPPLVSDEQIRDTFMYGSLIKDPEHGFMSGANYVRHEYEQDRAKTREVVQSLVDALDEMKDAFDLYASCQCDGTGCPVCRKLDKADNALFVAESMNIKPSRT